MEAPHMLRYGQNQYCENGYTTKNNQYFQIISSNSNDILHRERKTNSNIHMESERTLNCQGNPEQQEKILEMLQYLASNYTREP
jgi:hypothetical protein